MKTTTQHPSHTRPFALLMVAGTVALLAVGCEASEPSAAPAGDGSDVALVGPDGGITEAGGGGEPANGPEGESQGASSLVVPGFHAASGAASDAAFRVRGTLTHLDRGTAATNSSRVVGPVPARAR